jgi:hypothetical protein
MKLPHAKSAIIPPEKIKGYLLSPGHPIGRYKAAFFRVHGYEQNGWEALARDIRALLENDANLAERTQFGEKYTITGQVVGPNGRRFGLTTVWIILSGENAPRLVTAYPED